MRKKDSIIILSILMVLAINVCFADNPIVQTIYTADPAPLVYDGRVYLYTGHDENTASTSYLMKDYRCYSTADMVNWTDHGVVLPVNAFKWASQNDNANAAQVIYRNGKFYYYVSVMASGIALGVGVSTSPTGPFTDAIGRALITNDQTTYATHSWDNLDPTIFIDDDGQAYLYWGNNACYYVKLNSDMISYSGPITAIPLNTATFGPDYEEAPWIYKRNGIYYMVYASAFPESICYTTGTSFNEPWTYKGIIMNVQNGIGTNHPAVIDFNSSSYFFGHNRALPGGGDYKRSVFVENFSYNTDGSFPRINMTTTGAPQVGRLNPYTLTEAETICWESGIATEKCSEGGMDVCSIENGDYIKVKGVDFGTGVTSFEARVASGASGGNIELRIDSATGILVGTCAVAGTGGWQTWVTKTCTINGTSGVHDLYLKFTGSSGSLFSFNWWKFTGSGTLTPSSTPTPTPSVTVSPKQDPIWTGGPYTLNGTSDYVDLPDGITSNLNDFSVACWVKLNAVTNWVRIFDFGGDSNVFMMLTPQSGTTGFPYFAITTSGNAGEQGLNGISALPTGNWQHLAVVKTGSTGILYINKQEVARNTSMSLRPADLGDTTNNYIGRSQWTQDPYLNASVDKFVLYNRALSATEITDLPAVGGLKGDVNGDGIVTIVDAMLIAQKVSGLNPTPFIETDADVNCDGTININDALLVARYAAGLLTSLGC